MNWYVVIGILVAVFAIYRIISSGARRASNKVAQKLKVKPHLVEDMISVMGAERGQLFVKSLNSWEEESIDGAVYTFFIFQILKNQQKSNVKWWQDKMSECGYSTKLTMEEVETAYMFLRDFVADSNDGHRFLEIYESEYS